MNTNEIVEKIIGGYRIKRNDNSLIEYLKKCDFDELLVGADKLRVEFKGEFVDLCSIIPGKSGNCGENCKFCAQSAHNHFHVQMLRDNMVISNCRIVINSLFWRNILWLF